MIAATPIRLGSYRLASWSGLVMLPDQPEAHDIPTGSLSGWVFLVAVFVLVIGGLVGPLVIYQAVSLWAR